MQTEYEIVIADTSCFILLDKINELTLLKLLFGQVVTTPIIVKEFGADLPNWVQIKAAKDILLQNALDIDPGEASAIALALESGPSLLIIDDDKGRKLAKRLNLNITGSLGIFLKAKNAGIISTIKPLIEKVQQTNFRYSISVLEEILFLAGE
jgi:predicted nucleic acid-binding protein